LLEFHATQPQALAQGPYAAARAGVKPTTLRTKGVDSTKAPPHPRYLRVHVPAQYMVTLQIS